MSPAPSPAERRQAIVNLLASAIEAVEKSPDHKWDKPVENATPERKSLAVAPWQMLELVTCLADLAWGMEAADPADPRAAPVSAVTFTNLGVDLLINSVRIRHLINDCQGPSGQKTEPSSG